MGLKFREQMPFNIKLWLRLVIFMALFISLLAFFGDYTLWDKCVSCAQCNIFILLSSLTIVYIPLGMIVIARNRRDRMSLKTLSLLAVLPIVRNLPMYTACFLVFVRDGWDQ